MTGMSFSKFFGATAMALVTAAAPVSAYDGAEAPAKKYDMSHWKITVPVDENGDKKPDEIEVEDMKEYVHPDFFYLDADGGMVFVAPNKATTTANSSNTRSELRYMLRGEYSCDF